MLLPSCLATPPRPTPIPDEEGIETQRPSPYKIAPMVRHPYLMKKVLRPTVRSRIASRGVRHPYLMKKVLRQQV